MARTAAQPRAGLTALLAAKEMVLVCGSGGVGKTTAAAAMGVQAASEIGGRVRRLGAVTADTLSAIDLSAQEPGVATANPIQ